MKLVVTNPIMTGRKYELDNLRKRMRKFKQRRLRKSSMTTHSKTYWKSLKSWNYQDTDKVEQSSFLHRKRPSKNNQIPETFKTYVQIFLTSGAEIQQFFDDYKNNNLSETRCLNINCSNGECLAIRNRSTGQSTEFCKCKQNYVGHNCEHYLIGSHFSQIPVGKRKNVLEVPDTRKI